jgi:hypothetical protein
MSDKPLTNSNEIAVELDGSGVLAPGTSRRLVIRLPRSDVQQKVEYDVTDQDGNKVQSQTFRTEEGVESIESFLQAPTEKPSGELKVAVKVQPDEAGASAIVHESSYQVQA